MIVLAQMDLAKSSCLKEYEPLWMKFGASESAAMNTRFSVEDLSVI